MNLPFLKRIICVEGQRNSGKSTLLNHLCSSARKKFSASPLIYHKTFNNGADQHLVFRATKGRVTAICTPGDDANWIVRSFAVAQQHKCEVLVLAVSIPVRRSSIALAKNAFDDICIATNIVSILQQFRTTKHKPKKQNGYVDTNLVQQIFPLI
jgi:hypothetical protein